MNGLPFFLTILGVICGAMLLAYINHRIVLWIDARRTSYYRSPYGDFPRLPTEREP